MRKVYGPLAFQIEIEVARFLCVAHHRVSLLLARFGVTSVETSGTLAPAASKHRKTPLLHWASIIENVALAISVRRSIRQFSNYQIWMVEALVNSALMPD